MKENDEAGRGSLLAVIHNSGWLIFDKLVRMALGLLVGAWVARYLGPARYGELAYVLAYIAFFQAVALLGLDGIVVRDIARDRIHAGQILGTAFALRLAAGIACWLIAVGGMVWANGWQDRSVCLTALAGGSLVFQAADTVDLWFQSQSQSRRTVVAQLFAYLLSNGVKVLLILTHAPLISFAAVMTLDGLTAAAGVAIAYRRFPCGRRWQRATARGKQLVNESWPFMLSGLSIMVYMRIDQIMVKEMLGEKDLGIYAAVLPLSTLWQFIPMTLSASLAPYVARKKAESEQCYMQTLVNIFRLFALMGWLICIPTILLSGLLVNMLLGVAYQAGAAILPIHVFTNIFINMGVAQGLWLINEGKSKISLYKTIIGAVICIVGNTLLIPQMGIAGVALVAVLSQLGSALLSNIIFAPQIFTIQLRSLLLLRFQNLTGH